MVSIVMPVYYTNNTSYIVKRAQEHIRKFENRDRFELVIADLSKKPCLISNAKNIKIINTFAKTTHFSPAFARNLASTFATKKYLFFFDVDLDYDISFEEKFFTEIQNNLETGKKNFLMIPCLYLSKKGTEAFTSNQNIESLKLSLLKGENDLVLRLAVNTSALVIDKNYFFKIGKFSEDFIGHGGEDFELIHRLAAYQPHGKRNSDYYDDKVEQFPANYSGFRRYFSFYALAYFFTDFLIVHKWHERPLTNKFYFRRKPNELLLKQKMCNFDKFHSDIWYESVDLLPQQEYLMNLMSLNGYDIEEYPGLFRYKKGVQQPKGSFGAKTRKLLTRPKAFFLDMKLFRNLKKSN